VQFSISKKESLFTNPKKTADEILCKDLKVITIIIVINSVDKPNFQELP